jgi:hypothetical protein
MLGVYVPHHTGEITSSGILGVGIDELVERIGLVGVAACVGPGDLGIFPGHGCAEGVVGVVVGGLAGEGLRYVVIEGDFRVELLCRRFRSWLGRRRCCR